VEANQVVYYYFDEEGRIQIIDTRDQEKQLGIGQSTQIPVRRLCAGPVGWAWVWCIEIVFRAKCTGVLWVCTRRQLTCHDESIAGAGHGYGMGHIASGTKVQQCKRVTHKRPRYIPRRLTITRAHAQSEHVAGALFGRGSGLSVVGIVCHVRSVSNDWWRGTQRSKRAGTGDKSNEGERERRGRDDTGLLPDKGIMLGRSVGGMRGRGKVRLNAVWHTKMGGL
jgi:hypothetical protein